jgi:hypothetical protein
MSKNVEISMNDWQKLIDLHKKLGPLLFETVSMLQEVSYTSPIPRMASDAGRVFHELEPLAKLIFIEDAPFGIQKQK